jgi:hypothetical protein
MKRRIISIIIVIISALPAQAELITIEITAEVDSVLDGGGRLLEGRINIGDIITGTYTYDSDTQDSNPSSTVGSYWHYAPPAGISLTVGGFEFQTDPANLRFLVGIGNDSTSDSYILGSNSNLPLSNGTLVSFIVWQLVDPTATALSSDALPTTPPILGQWQENFLRIGDFRTFFIDAHVTSAVPEPATILLFSLGVLFLRKRSK